MTSKQYWKKISHSFLKLHQNIKKNKTVFIESQSFEVFPGVFSPEISSDTEWFAKKVIPLIHGKSFLEIGTGIGAIACLAALNGAAKVVATDINPHAVKNAVYNAKKHKLVIPILEGSVFSPLSHEQKFDVIFWNHPFNHVEEQLNPEDPLLYSVFDPQYSSLIKYFEDGKKFLNNTGILLLGTGNIARIRMIRQLSQKYGYKMSLLEKEDVNLSQYHKTKMDIRIYAFSLN